MEIKQNKIYSLLSSAEECVLPASGLPDFLWYKHTQGGKNYHKVLYQMAVKWTKWQ
jgi:hypothetical protein